MTGTMSLEARYDMVVIGGGPAGLAGAVALGRSLRTVLVVDGGRPRNARAAHAHNYLGREGVSPRELLADGRTEARGYGVQVHEGTVTHAVRTDDGFTVTLADGTTTGARRLLVTTGLRDELPDVPGLAERWGRDVLHCSFCHGWEVRGQRLVVLGTGPAAAHQAGLFRQLSDDVTLLLHSGDEPPAEVLAGLTARGVRVLRGRAVALEVTDDTLTGLRLESGELVPAQAVVVATGLDGVSALPGGLGLEPTELVVDGVVLGRHLAVDATGATAVAGVWAAGNVASPMAQVITAAGAGLNAGAAINADLVAEDTRHAVDDLRRTAEWDGVFGGTQRFSGNVNDGLVQEVAGLAPGTALDLGCGEGGDVVWLAQQGWTVTGVDVSPVALERAAAAATAAGVEVTLLRTDLASAFPSGSFDLVSMQFLHSRAEVSPGPALLRRAASVVAPGGLLLVVGHEGTPDFVDAHGHPVDHDTPTLPTLAEVRDPLEQPGWEVLKAESWSHEHAFPDGSHGHRRNFTVLVRRS
jgi:thioredoxin reductase/SAM-dependent methyltransferase